VVRLTSSSSIPSFLIIFFSFPIVSICDYVLYTITHRILISIVQIKFSENKIDFIQACSVVSYNISLSSL
jgi:hypothetical protein